MANENNIKLELIIYCYNKIFNEPYEIINDPINKLFFNFNEVDKILQIKEPKTIKFIYFNKLTIHKILYNEEEIINIVINNKESLYNLNIYFYLLLLLLDNKDIINYSFSIEFIRNINDYIIIPNINEICKKLISAKIIIELINYYEKEIKENEELNKIKKYNMDIITNNISVFKDDMDLEWKQEEFLSKNIEDIYIDIIEKILLKKSKFEKYDYTYSIVNQLDLLNIDLIKKMFDKLKNILNNNKEYIQKYIIFKKEDLNDENKINYNYILLKYILKNPFYIYQIPFLIKTKQFLINLTNDDINEISNYHKNNNINDKIDFIITNITDSEYYYNKFKINSYCSNQINGTNNNYFESDNSYNEEKKTENLKYFAILPIEPILTKYLDSEFIHNSNIICKIMSKSYIIFNIDKLKTKISDEIIYYGKNDSIKYKDFKKYFKIRQKFNNQILDLLFLNYILFIKFLEKIKKKVKNMDINDLQLSIKLNIETIKEKSDNVLDYICCKYTLINPSLYDINKNKNIYQDNNILINKKYNNFDIFLKDIINIIYQDLIIEKKEQNLSNFSNINSNNYSTTTKSKNEMPIKFPKCKIIVLTKVIETNKKPVEYVKELNKRFIIAGTDDKLIIYDKIDNKIKEINFPNCKNYGFCELEKKDIILFYSNYIIKAYSLKDMQEKKGEIKDISNIFIKNIIQINKNIFIICSKNSILLMENLDINNDLIQLNKNTIYEKSYIGAIKINDNNFAFTSNRVLSNGEDKIIFYNLKFKKFIKEIKGYSFIESRNNLSTIPIPDKYNKTKNDKLLFCACKKYIKSQKNGILLLKLKIIDNDINDIYKIFYKTGNFEVYCFCNISKFNNNIIIGNKKNNYTEYILIGGYDNYKRKGLIKLYEIIYNEDIEKIKLEYIQDIQIDKIKNINSKSFEGFKKPITCIEQSKENGNILISSFDGNIYFCQLNLEKLYLKNDFHF